MSRGTEFDPGRPERCKATYDGHRCSLPLGHGDSHKADTGTELVNFHDSDKGAPGGHDVNNPDTHERPRSKENAQKETESWYAKRPGGPDDSGEVLHLDSKGDMIEMDLKGNRMGRMPKKKEKPSLFAKGGEGRYGHALFYRGKFTGAAKRVIPKEE